MPPDREPTETEIAAMISFVKDPDDETAAVAAVSSRIGWSEAESRVFVANNRDWMLEIADEIRTAAQATGGNLQQAARLSSKRDERQALLYSRRRSFAAEMAALMPNDQATVADVFTPQQLVELLAKHGLVLGESGEPELAEDAAPDRARYERKDVESSEARNGRPWWRLWLLA